MGTYTKLPNLYLPSQAGAPLSSGINNTAGELITLLDAILVDGYGSVTLSSLVVASGVATATVSTGHGFVNVGTYGPVVRVAGSSVTELNGDKRITVTSATTFTFDATGVADGTAGGTITAKMAPAGWTKEFSGTNKAVYRPGSGLRHYLRVDDTGTTAARVRGFVSMSDVDTGTEPFPTDAQQSGGLYAYKSSASTRRAWIAVADERALYLFMDPGGNNNYFGPLVFGQFINALPGDGYCTQISAINVAAIASPTFADCGIATVNDGLMMPRSIAQTGTAIIGSRMQAGRNTQNLGMGGEDAPPACGFRRFVRVEVWDGLTTFRGWLPGVWSTSYVVTPGSVLEGFSGDLGGRTLYAMNQGSTQGWSMDITGPWFDD